MKNKTNIRIGCASAFWGDTPEAVKQLVQGGKLDYLVFDYLAEVTMSLLVRARAKHDNLGYAADFVPTIAAHIEQIVKQNIKVVSNAGGINPLACRDAMQAACKAAGHDIKIAVVLGDDLLESADALRNDNIQELHTGQPLPEKLGSVNAYLGARPITDALNQGAQIVITGRCVDSAVTLGPLCHEFGWKDNDYDLLSSGSLAGHLLECGPQATGGLFTDWASVPGWDNMGFPIVECQRDGRFTLSKAPETGGLITPATVAEQLVYEIGDPSAYILPDVVCDWTEVKLDSTGSDQVAVSGARGYAPTASYKVAATYYDGFRCSFAMMVGGVDAKQKAQRIAESLIARTQRLFKEKQLGDYRDTSVEVIGAEDTYGPHSRVAHSREVLLKLAVHHNEKAALEIFTREIAPIATSMAPGIAGGLGGRPKVTDVVRLYSFLLDKNKLQPTVEMHDQRSQCVIHKPGQASKIDEKQTTAESVANGNPDQGEATVEIPLIRLAHGRSGDKGNLSNIGILARDAKYVDWLRHVLTEDAVADYFSHIVEGKVERFELPGINGFNFLLHNALAGGGMASLRFDPLGKALAQMMLDMPIPVPKSWIDADATLR
jgi:Acyclic terpene utilisation family protein AtuA